MLRGFFVNLCAHADMNAHRPSYRFSLLGRFIALLTLAMFAPTASASEAELTGILKEQGLHGAVWSTVAASGTVTLGAGGIRNALTGEAMRTDDRVHVGSIAKTLVATGVLRLVSQGRLTLETPVSTLLPDIQFDNRWDATDPVRVRHLMDHTSGLDDARFSQVFTLHATPDTPLADAFAVADSLLTVRSRPGAHVSYSNMAYTLLGRIVEKVTAERYETYLQSHLLDPLQMRDSSFHFTTQSGPQADPRIAMGHFDNGATHAAVPMYLRPASQFTTTAADMAKLARFLMGNGQIDGKPFIDKALLGAMGRPHETEAALAGLQAGYALGLMTRDRHGAIGKCHGGSTVGFRAMLCLYPEQQKAYFIAMNTDSETANHGLLDATLIKMLHLHLHLQPPPGPIASYATFDATEWEGYYIPAPNRFASLVWLDTVFNAVRLRQHGAGLQLTSLQSPPLVLRHAGGPLYRATGRLAASHAFAIDGTGERIFSTGSQSYEKISAVKLFLLWASLAAGMLGLLWILAAGIVRAAMRRHRQWTLLPFIGAVGLLLPLPFFFAQSFLQLGDVTIASATLAGATALLPLTMVAGLVLAWRARTATAIDTAAMLGVLQFSAVLAYWGLLPFRLWA
jgi:CubicO group peptidase (beta-lactamase class C family)